MSPEALEFMADGLADLPADALTRAATRARNACRWFPTVAELRDMGGRGTPGADDAVAAEAMAAWETARAWCMRHRDRLRSIRTGLYGNDDQGDLHLPTPPPIVPLPGRVFAALVQCGGVNRVMQFRDDPEETKWCRRDFIEAYRLAPAVEDAARSLAAGDPQKIAEALAGRMALGAAK